MAKKIRFPLEMENDIEVIQQVYDLGGKDARIRMKALKDWMKQ